jgi:predicted MFS family arabinose efflux permease
MTIDPSSAMTDARRTARLITRWPAHALGLYVLLIYGVTYYAIGTAAPRMASDLGVATSTIFGMLSGALLLSAVLAPRLGIWTDHAGGAHVLLIGAALRAAALIAMALAPEFWGFALAFVVVQLLSQVTEYDATFATAVQVTGDDARAAISQITLWGGVASTVFWPATAFLLEHMSWRQMFLLYAALLIVTCVPIAAALRRSSYPGSTGTQSHEAEQGEAVPDAADRPVPPVGTFVLLAAAFAFGGFAYNMPVLMLPVLEGLGLGSSAVLAGMLFGPSQTAGRFLDLVFGWRIHALGVALIASALMALSLAILFLGGGIVWTGILFAILFGAGVGVSYVVRGSVVLALYGRTHYAAWLGRLGSVRLVVAAASPFVLSVILERWGASSVVAFCAVVTTLSLACFFALRRRYS